jgi:hypothetical protein
MSRVRASEWLLQKKLVMIAAAMVAIAALAVGLQPVFPVSADAEATAQEAAIVFQIEPNIVHFPPKRLKNHGVWLIAAGLEPDQEVKFQMVWGIAEMITDITSVLVHHDKKRGGVFANMHGAVAVGFERGFRSADEDWLFYKTYDEAMSLRMVDAISGETLAVSPLLICGPAAEEPWCKAASEVVKIK